MRYWKGLLIAVAFDVTWSGGRELRDAERAPRSLADVPVWPFAAPIPAPSDSLSLEAIASLDRTVDSLMLRLQRRPGDVDALRTLAALYAEHGWFDEAVSPLARALELAPGDAQLRRALVRAIAAGGLGPMSDADLARAAREFLEAVAMWGHGC